MYSEEELLPLSALQHLLFCERRAALIYIEGLWDENPYTVEGLHFHERSHESETESRGNTRIARAVPLRSLRLGLSGKADVVEFHRMTQEQEQASGGIRLQGVPGLWVAFPIEYKRGRLRHEKGYEVQLCGQAICLEEMLKAVIPTGAIYYGKTGRRLDVAFTGGLRRETMAAAARLHELIRQGTTPVARFSKKCGSCSLEDICVPKTTGKRQNIEKYMADAIRAPEGLCNEASP